MADPKLVTLTKLGEIRNKDATLFQVIQEVQSQTNEHILDQAKLVGLLRSNGDVVVGAEISGDGTTSGSNALTVTKLNGASLAGLATGILKNTTGTGVPSIAVAADFPVLNQDTTGKAAKADALSTTGAAVNVSAATPPTAGQALVATDATHATWQAPATASVLFAQTADRVTTANAQSTLFGTGTGSLTLPANFFTVGRSIRVTLSGWISTSGASASKQVFVTLGGTTVAYGTGVTTYASQASYPWSAQVVITCRTTGATGTVIGGGFFDIESSLTTEQTSFPLGAWVQAVATVNTTGTLAVDVQFSDGSVAGQLTTSVGLLEAL